ncbi:MAG: rod shape-determining protein MreD [Lachnospiraceae bacterium]|jgi:rod shape-determining protein MreD|nr:rod shape-determining protein MreD [Lachnospiraceae bacterium]MCH4030463.1 rod shape-determining protein MreD [Lachnospiraceae bacterium]MCH4069673.1 rod shape-determining protein MreD [Lachnospiraceae bacterium]MCH4107389.1 rod shape-determining protein MreD [Lachnospiraceae bacterium]MCI1301757.1 rod shape-determining protein MreD [Lachnospiraceae bacterium]
MKYRLYQIALIFVFFLAETVLVPLIRVSGNGPELLLLLPVFFGFFGGPVDGIFAGLLAGILADVYGGTLLGTSAFLFVCFGFLSGKLLENVEQEEFFFPMMLTFVSAFLYECAMWFILFVLHNRIDAEFFFTRKILPISLYTLVAGIALYFPVRAFDRKMREAYGTGEKRNAKNLS